MAYLTREKYVSGNREYEFNIRCFVCDAPAKSFVKCVVGHNSYYGCCECKVEGVYFKNRVTYMETNAELRSDTDFGQNNFDDHIKEESILHKELNCGMVSKFPLDYMHLICHGVVKQMIISWKKGNLICRQRGDVIENISKGIMESAKTTPFEFSRHPRTLNDCERWKATEFRQFILYIGPIVLKNQLPTELYNHFMLLHVAVVILSSAEYYVEFNEYASRILVIFVENFGRYYGNEKVCHNVHNLIHIASHCLKFGNLDNFSAFPFENYMRMIKSKVRKGNNVLEQIRNNYFELLPELPLAVLTYSKIKYKGRRSELKFEQFKISNNDRDNHVLLNNNKVVLFENVLNRKHFLGKEYEIQNSAYSHPIDSKHLHIYQVNSLKNTKTYEINEIKAKLYVICRSNYMRIVIPMIHTKHN